MSRKPKTSIRQLVKLYAKHQNVAAVARKVGRHYTAVHQRLKRAGLVGK